jgi:hypothetical protein
MTSDIDPRDLVRDVATRGAAAVGLAALFTEGAVVAVSAYAFATAGRVATLSGARIPVRGNGIPVAA